MVNLLSNDVNRFDTSLDCLHNLWVAPLQLLICTGLLWNKIGPSALVGTVLLLAAVPLQSMKIVWLEKATMSYFNIYFSMGGKAVCKVEGWNCRENWQENKADEWNYQWNESHKDVQLGDALLKTDAQYKKVRK